MATLAKNVLHYGSEGALPEPVKLRAGALSLVYDDGTIRTIKLGDDWRQAVGCADRTKR